MVIRDKQDLRKCVKQSVRRAPVVETCVHAGAVMGTYGIAARLGEWAELQGSLKQTFDSVCAGTPFAKKPAALLAALDALHLPVHDLDKAEALISGYGRDAYLAAALDAMRAHKVLVKIASCDALQIPQESRLQPLIMLEDSLFEAGRYGVNYEKAAERVVGLLLETGARHVALETFDFDALAYCLVPLCEDTGATLHVHFENEAQMRFALDMLGSHEEVKAVVSAEAWLEPMLIEAAALHQNIRVQLRELDHIALAFRHLGLRFIPYASCEDSPEAMLGGWIQAKEAIWQAMYDAYLPLARTGYELTRERIEADAEQLLCSNFCND